MERLDLEPSKLHAQVAQLDLEIQTLSVKNIEVHTANNACLQRIRQGAQALSGDASALNENLSPLAESCAEFLQAGKHLHSQFQINRQTLHHHPQLRDLLELPQVMSSCAREKMFSEALEVCSFASTLQMRHQAIAEGLRRSTAASSAINKNKDMNDSSSSQGGGGLVIISAVVQDVDRCAVLMRDQLLLRLKQPITLPVSLSVISYLRRLDNQRTVWQQQRERRRRLLLDGARGGRKRHIVEQKEQVVDTGTTPKECRLRHEFLACRSSAFQEVSAAAAGANNNNNNNPYRALFDVIERNRRHWFDLINQYNNIFDKGANCLESVHLDGGILSRWISSQVSVFLATLRTLLPLVQGCGSVANILEQCMYFGSSLARVGADIRPLLLPIFQKRVRAAALEYWRPISQRAHTQLAKGEWGEPLPVPAASAKSTTSASGSIGANAALSGEGEADDDVQAKGPPLSLLAFPVLAELTNVMVMSMNELMQCAAPSFVATLGADLAVALRLVVDGVVAFADAPENQQKLKDDVKAKRRFVHLVDLLRDELLPLVKGWLFAIFRLPTQHRAVRRFCDLRPMLILLEEVGARFHSDDELPVVVVSPPVASIHADEREVTVVADVSLPVPMSGGDREEVGPQTIDLAGESEKVDGGVGVVGDCVGLDSAVEAPASRAVDSASDGAASFDPTSVDAM